MFAVNLQVKLLRATVKNADTGILKSLHTLFDTYLDNMLVKFVSCEPLMDCVVLDTA